MITDNAERDEAVIAVIVAFMREAELTADLTVAYLKKVGPSLKDDQSSWPATFLLELGAALRIQIWEAAGIQDAIEASLPSFQEAITDLSRRLQTEPERFIRGETLVRRVLHFWWLHCAHPNEQFLDIDVVLSMAERSLMISGVADLLWRIRELELDTVNTTSMNRRPTE